MIKIFIQGNKKTDNELYSDIGHIILDRKIHKKLGTAITSDEGSFWAVNKDHNKKVNGLANMKIFKNGSAHIRIIYSDNDSTLRECNLIKALIKIACEKKCTLAYSNERTNKSCLKKEGFTYETEPKKKGGFVRWVKSLKEDRLEEV